MVKGNNINKIYLITLLSVILILIMTRIVYINLPFTITRGNDIKSGNKMIIKIEKYYDTHKRLPNTGDWIILKEIGFKFKGEGTRPDYQKLSNNRYKLTFLEGFDGPYLMYDSLDKKWKIGF